MRPDNALAVIDALLAYGEAARNDDMYLDGKTIRDDMEILANILGSNTPYTKDQILDKLCITFVDGAYEWT